eukprot:1627977-Amphidinium_carterae.1
MLVDVGIKMLSHPLNTACHDVSVPDLLVIIVVQVVVVVVVGVVAYEVEARCTWYAYYQHAKSNKCGRLGMNMAPLAQLCGNTMRAQAPTRII